MAAVLVDAQNESWLVMDWIAIISGLVLPLIAKCFSKTSSEDPKAVLAAHYNPATGKMDGSVVREAMPSVRQAARKAHRQASREDRKTFPRLSNSDVYDIAEKNLIKAMSATSAEVSAVFYAAAALGDDE